MARVLLSLLKPKSSTNHTEEFDHYCEFSILSEQQRKTGNKDLQLHQYQEICDQ